MWDIYGLFIFSYYETFIFAVPGMVSVNVKMHDGAKISLTVSLCIFLYAFDSFMETKAVTHDLSAI